MLRIGPGCGTSSKTLIQKRNSPYSISEILRQIFVTKSSSSGGKYPLVMRHVRPCRVYPRLDSV